MSRVKPKRPSAKREARQQALQMKRKRRLVEHEKKQRQRRGRCANLQIDPQEARRKRVRLGNLMSRMWPHALTCLVAALLLAACGDAKLCRPCERKPETVKVEIDWQKLADALKDAQVPGGGTTVWTNSINVTISGQPGGTVTVAGWDDLVEVLGSIQTAATEQTAHMHHTTFAFRFAPPWFNSDQRSLFTSYVVFPEEAKLEEWLGDEVDEGCPRKDGRMPSSVCPDTAFYAKAMGPFLKGLSRCATDKKVELYTVGFASSTGLDDVEEDDEEALRQRYEEHLATIAEDCLGEKEELEDRSLMFNLLVANERAVNAATMLQDLIPEEAKGDFVIKAMPWCSHANMKEQRSWDDRGDTAIGLMNRRAEVRLQAIPGCVDIDPDNRLDKTE